MGRRKCNHHKLDKLQLGLRTLATGFKTDLPPDRLGNANITAIRDAKILGDRKKFLYVGTQAGQIYRVDPIIIGANPELWLDLVDITLVNTQQCPYAGEGG